MTSKHEAKNKISAASRGCEAAENEWRAAAAAINGSISTNGYGIHHDCYQLRNKLLDAQEHIKKALIELNNIDWPRNHDYDLAE